MPLRFSTSRSLPDSYDALAVGVYADQLDDDSSIAESLDADFLRRQGYKAEPGETRALPGDKDRTSGRGRGQDAFAVGLGRRDEATPATFRRVGAALANAASRHKRVATTLLDDLPGGVDAAAAARAFAEGMVLGSYRFSTYKSAGGNDRDSAAAIDRVTVVEESAGTRTRTTTTAALKLGQAIASAQCLARDLVNEPGGSLTPSVFAERAVNLGREHGFAVRVRDERGIQRARLGGLLGVNRGSSEPPRFLELSWPTPVPPRKARTPTVALVGKGITFDSGGLSLKSSEGMRNMKGDMAGAAAVVGTFCALASVRPKVQVKGFIPLTDNMPGSDATRIGDVLHIRNGTTVEVLNTDAEGRLVLADALVMASEARPNAIVDIATLTGGCKVALGDRIAGLMGNDQALINSIRWAAEEAGEEVWHLPLPKQLRSKLDSEIADIKNVAGREGSALTAGLFLQEFVADDIAWVHLDIAGPADSTENDGEIRKGGTGFGVRTLLALLENFTG